MTSSPANNRVPASLLCLKKIDCTPTDFNEPLYAHYPAMKLGVSSAIDFYADKLQTLARRSLAEHPQCQDWVITAPLFNAVPAAANLLCWKMYDLLTKSLPAPHNLSLVDLHLEPQRMQINTEQDFKTYYEYSNNSVEQRIRERSRLHEHSDDIIRQADAFTGKGVLIINDIKVTGTQQEFMSRSFAQVAPVRLQWLYIFEIEQGFGTSHPHIEHQINHSTINTVEAFTAVLCAAETQHTARCISRLFSYGTDDFELLITQLPVNKRNTILHYAAQEGRFEGDYFIDKFNALKALCEKPALHTTG